MIPARAQDDVQRAMDRFDRYRDAGPERRFYIEVSGGPPTSWWFLHDGSEYPLKAIWAAAAGIPCDDTHTNRAKIELRRRGYGEFFERNKTSRPKRVVPSNSPVAALLDSTSAFGGGEGEDHIAAKDFVSKNPAAVGLPSGYGSGVQEYPLPSGDRVDVVFIDDESVCAIEVKPRAAPDSDILRGLFQCVKYEAVLKAVGVVGGKPNVSVKLALAGTLPECLREMRDQLSIEVIELRMGAGRSSAKHGH